MDKSVAKKKRNRHEGDPSSSRKVRHREYQVGAPQRRGQGTKQSPSVIKKSLRSTLDVLYYIIIIGIILGSVLFVGSKDPNKSFFGYRFYAVLTNSMVPQKDSPPGGFYAGDVTIVKMASYDQLKVNDIVTFQVGKDAYLTHRLIEKLSVLNEEEGAYMVTKGDANPSPDPPVDGKKAIGKVVLSIPFVGSTLTFMRTHFVVCVVFLISLFGFVWVIRLYLMQPEEERRTKRRSGSSKRAKLTK